MHESDSDDEDLDGSAINHSARGNGIASRVKLEQLGGDAEAVLGLSRLKHGSLDRDSMARSAVTMTIQQQMVAAAAMGSLLSGGATPWTPSLPPVSPGVLSINASTTGVPGAATQVISSSSPGGGSGSSGSGNSGSHLDAGKGYTFEEQFKQVRLMTAQSEYRQQRLVACDIISPQPIFALSLASTRSFPPLTYGSLSLPLPLFLSHHLLITCDAIRLPFS